MSSIQSTVNSPVPKQPALYYQLVALWVVGEALLGGIIHGFKIPVSGLVVGSWAVTSICLLAWYVPRKGIILQATLVVAIFKMMLSPQAPPPAYIAVFFQGLLGELLFWRRRFFQAACILLAVLSLLESGLQRILVLTIVYGNDLWNMVDRFFQQLTGQERSIRFSQLIGAIYVVLHLVTGMIVGWWASRLPMKMKLWSNDPAYLLPKPSNPVTSPEPRKRRKKKWKLGLFIVWILLIALYLQSLYGPGAPLLPAHISLRIFIRSVIIVCGWMFIIGPLLRIALHRWLQRKKLKAAAVIQQVLEVLPASQQLIQQSWSHAATSKGWSRIRRWTRIVLANALGNASVESAGNVYILTGPIQSGKTTALMKWSANQPGAAGVLTPVINGKRFFLDVRTREQFPMEAIGDEPVLVVGRFQFSRRHFEKACQLLREASHTPGWLLIDEIGPLELRGDGFADILKEILRERKGPLLLVIREKENIREELIRAFQLGDVSIITDLTQLP